MDKAEFDAVADEYEQMLRRSVAASGESPEFFARYKIEDLARVAHGCAIGAREILDFGSGIGNSLPHFQSFFPEAAVTCAESRLEASSSARSAFPT